MASKYRRLALGLCTLLIFTPSAHCVLQSIDSTLDSAGQAVQGAFQAVSQAVQSVGQVLDFERQLTASPGLDQITFKTTQALHYAWMPDVGGAGPDTFQSYPLANGAALKMYIPHPQHVVLAFSAPNLPLDAPAPVDFMQAWLPTAQAPSVGLQTFAQLHNGPSTAGPLADVRNFFYYQNLFSTTYDISTTKLFVLCLTGTCTGGIGHDGRPSALAPHLHW